MNCFECAKTNDAVIAVGVCSQCGVGLCLDHMIEAGQYRVGGTNLHLRTPSPVPREAAPRRPGRHRCRSRHHPPRRLGTAHRANPRDQREQCKTASSRCSPRRSATPPASASSACCSPATPATAARSSTSCRSPRPPHRPRASQGAEGRRSRQRRDRGPAHLLLRKSPSGLPKHTNCSAAPCSLTRSTWTPVAATETVRRPATPSPRPPPTTRRC